MDQFGAATGVARRHGLVILWLASAAMRFSELAQLRVEALSVAANTVVIQGRKGSARNEVQVCELLVDATMNWRSRYNIDSELLLPSQNNRPIDNNAFNRDVMDPLGELFGIKLSAHSLRDTGAQQALAIAESKGLGVQAVQSFMRHRSLNSTEPYLRKQREKSIKLDWGLSPS
jgi:integrase